MRILKYVFLFSLLFLLLSCGSDCQQVEVEKAEWVTRYEDYIAKDTLASYSIVRDYIDFDESYSSQIRNLSNSYNQLSKDIDLLYNNIAKNSTYNDFINLLSPLRKSQKKPSGKNSVYRVVDIRNNSNFPASFAIRDENNFNNSEADYQVIKPHNTATFHLSWSVNWNVNNSSGFQSGIVILQKKQNPMLIHRIDELILSTDTVNTCEQSVEALKKQYQSIKDLYYNHVGKTLDVHKVVQGETLSGIAKKYDVSVSDLCTWNNLSKKEINNIRQGQELYYVKTDSTQWKVITDKPRNKNNSIY
jgi:LysM repeat protein